MADSKNRTFNSLTDSHEIETVEAVEEVETVFQFLNGFSLTNLILT